MQIKFMKYLDFIDLFSVVRGVVQKTETLAASE
jgi:hypothetical protein